MNQVDSELRLLRQRMLYLEQQKIAELEIELQ